jgi:hypothetical protein
MADPKVSMSRSRLAQPSKIEPTPGVVADATVSEPTSESRSPQPSGWWSAASALAGTRNIPRAAAAVARAAMRARSCRLVPGVSLLDNLPDDEATKR